MANKNKIQDALGEAREDLILNKYNEAMMLMAQITMDVIEHLTDEALIVSKGYEEDLKTLRTNGILGEDTAHNFETLIISGVQAHSGVNIPKEHAEQALQVLTNELDILFNGEDITPSYSENLEEKPKYNANSGNPVFEYDEDEEPYPGDFSKDMTTEGSTPAFMQRGVDGDDYKAKERMKEQMLQNENGYRMGRKRRAKLISILIPIVLFLLFVFVVRGMFFNPNRRQSVDETLQIIESTEPETQETEPTEPPLPPESGYYDVTGDLVKIRDAATIEGSKVLGTVSKGGKVLVKSFYNADWAIIMFEGKEAYISRRYIKKDESLSPVFEE